jgi:hypothetical protein
VGERSRLFGWIGGWTGRAVSLLAAAALSMLVALAGLPAAPASADTITVTNVQADTEDPTAVTFTARVVAPAGLTEARLNYSVLNPKEGDVGGGGDATFGPGAENDVSFTLTTRDAQRYIPVGSIFRFHWVFTDEDGDTVTTEEQEYLFLDGQFDWESHTEGDITVYWYGANEGVASAVIGAAEASLDETQQLLGVQVPYPIRIMVWESEADGTLARRQQSATFDEQVHTGGQRVAPDVLFVFAQSETVVRHETAHIVTAVAGDGPFSSIPSWLDEGTAVYMQGDPEGYGFAIEFAIENDRTLSLRGMQSPTNTPSEIDIFYGQAYSTVGYLVEQYGQEQFADLFRTVREGASIDTALEAVYGVDQDGLYNEWRVANGLEPLDIAPRAESTQGPAAEATARPLAIPTSQSAPDGGSDDGETDASAPTPDDAGEPAEAANDDSGGSNTAGLIVGGIVLLVGLALGGGALVMMRKGRRAAS